MQDWCYEDLLWIREWNKSWDWKNKEMSHYGKVTFDGHSIGYNA